MENRVRSLSNECNFSSVKPIMMDLPYPPVRVERQNPAYANLLGMDLCGAVSELTATAQYINHENCIACERCAMAKVVLGIAMAEMIHLQKLGELVVLLGGEVNYTVKGRDGRGRMWTPEYLTLPRQTQKMLLADIEAEKEAIRQYRMHINMIDDECVNDMLRRIIKDEEYHIVILQALLEEC